MIPSLPPANSKPVGNGMLLALDYAAIALAMSGPNGPVNKAVAKAARNIERSAKRYCPVDTGRLRSSITSVIGQQDGEFVGVVGSNVKYAPHVEFGTYKMGAQSFLRRALDDELRKGITP